MTCIDVPASDASTAWWNVRRGSTTGELYRLRGQIELFFRWIKPNLRIRSFYGTTANAVRVQLWIAISVYLAVAILRKQLGLSRSLSCILQILAVNVFQKMPVSELPAEKDKSTPGNDIQEQLSFSGC